MRNSVWLRAMAPVVVAVMAMSVPASAATLEVGANAQYKAPSDAASAASDGDTIVIEPGTYFDCAVWHANNITIEGKGPGVVLTDKICMGKAIMVIDGTNTTIRNLTLQRARANDGNGAGIRAEANDLTLENMKIINNQDGILAGDNPASTITIRHSEFIKNGTCERACAHGIYVGHIKALNISDTRFFDTQVGHHIKSRASSTTLTHDTIEDGPDGTASYEVDIPNGGALVMTGNTIEKGPKNQNHSAVVIIGEEGVSQPTDQIVIRNNTVTNDGPPTTFIKNLTATPAELSGNHFKGPIQPLMGDGSVK